MLSNFFKPLNLICIVCYVAFMVIAMDSSAVDALVFFVSEDEGKPVYISGTMATTPLATQSDSAAKPIVAIQYKKTQVEENLAELDSLKPEIKPVLSTEEPDEAADENDQLNLTMKTTSVSESKSIEIPMKTVAASAKMPLSPAPVAAKEAVDEVQATEKPEKTPSALEYLKAVAEKKWEYASLLDRYIVQYDKDTYIVLTIRPKLQKKLEKIYRKYSTRIGASILQDPSSGEILAMTSCHKNKTLDIESEDFKKEHWALKATFPVASIFKIITASAGIDSGKITPNSRFIAWRKSYMKVWKAFARSHNGVFGKIARKAGKKLMDKYIDAFGFNKTFFFDLPVGKSLAKLPTNKVKMGQAAAGLNRDFLVSPMHVASIVSTVLNRGKTMKPYLVDYVVRKNNIIFRRKPFQIAQPIKASTARDIYKMMYTTTAIGTGKKGFGGYRKCPDLAKICGGKTGTLTGASPHYLFTWFGGFTKATGRDMCIVTLVGQRNHSGTKAASIAGQIAYELYMDRQDAKAKRVAAK
jgi:membrane peptidoglycan carboxypeptidase